MFPIDRYKIEEAWELLNLIICLRGIAKHPRNK